MRPFLLAPLIAAIPVQAFAEPLTFSVAVERATRDAPSVLAGEANVEAKRSASVAAGRLPDPTLNLDLDNFPVSGPPAFSFTRESTGSWWIISKNGAWGLNSPAPTRPWVVVRSKRKPSTRISCTQ